MSIPITEVINRWSHLFRNFSCSADEFYGELQLQLQEQQMPKTDISRVTHKEKGFFSSSRDYLRIKRNNLVFDVCAAPFGTNFFISWWLYETSGTMAQILKNTSIGNVMTARAAKKTFFEFDSEQMFRECVHDALLQAVSGITEGKGGRQLTDAEREYKVGGF